MWVIVGFRRRSSRLVVEAPQSVQSLAVLISNLVDLPAKFFVYLSFCRILTGSAGANNLIVFFSFATPV